MSNYEERNKEEDGITSPTPLDKWNAAKEDTYNLLSVVRSKLNSASISARGMTGRDYQRLIDELNGPIRNIMGQIMASRAPHSVVDASNDQLEREKNDRLRRAREQFSRMPDTISSSGTIYESKAWGKLSSVAATLTEDNNGTAQPFGEMVRLQIHPADTTYRAFPVGWSKCPCGHIFYTANSIGNECGHCKQPLPPF